VLGLRFSHAGHAHHAGRPRPLRKRALLTLLAAAVLAALALLVAPPHAHGNFVYWANDDQTSIGRAKINGAGANNSFITGVDGVHGIAIDSKFVYWTTLNGGMSAIGRANLDGSGRQRHRPELHRRDLLGHLLDQPGGHGRGHDRPRQPRRQQSRP